MLTATTRWSTFVERIENADLGSANVDDVKAVVRDVARTQSWLESVMVSASTRLRELAQAGAPVSPVHALADAGGLDLRPADQIALRAETLEHAPALADSLQAGSASGAHVDVLARTLRTLDHDERQRFMGRQEHFAAVADQTTAAEFKRFLAAEAQRVRRGDGLERFERQRRDTRLHTWWGAADGMFHLRGQFDPELGQLLDAALTQRVDALFHDQHPPTAPTDPVERQAHLRALALGDLVGSAGCTNTTRTNVHVLIDVDTLRHGLHDHSVVEGHTPDAQLPVETIRRLACDAHIIPVVLGGEGLPLDVGRASRLATPAQRAALRAVYSTCALCDAPFQHCTIHHLLSWEHDGPTDLDNLCSRHHHCAHEGGWRLSLDRRTRCLTTTRPDGVTRASPLPRAAAGGVGPPLDFDPDGTGAPGVPTRAGVRR